MSSGGPAPSLPDSGWRVLYQEALTRWLQAEPNLLHVEPVAVWLAGCKQQGPPGRALELGDDRFLARVPGTPVTVEYLVIAYEFLIIIKEIR